MSKKIYGNGKRIDLHVMRSIVFSSTAYARYFIKNANETTLREALKEAKVKRPVKTLIAMLKARLRKIEKSS